MREVLGKLAWAVIGLAAVLLVGYAVLMFYLSDTLDKEGESAGSDAASSTAGSSTPALTPAAELQTASCTDLDALMQQHLPDLTAAAQSNGEEHVLLHLECDNVAGELAVDSAIGYQPGGRTPSPTSSLSPMRAALPARADTPATSCSASTARRRTSSSRPRWRPTAPRCPRV